MSLLEFKEIKQKEKNEKRKHTRKKSRCQEMMQYNKVAVLELQHWDNS